MGMERWFEASKQRFSVRRYDAGPSEDALQSLKGAAAKLEARGVRISLGVSERAFRSSPILEGRIRGTDCYAAFLSKGAQPESVGYIGEAFILECTALGLGTCWAGASYNRAAILGELGLSEDEKLICVTPIGHAGEAYEARPRRTLERLTGLARAELDALAEWQRYALECARRAPSAINRQPWAFRVNGASIEVVNKGANFGYGRIDRGIAMLHMELGAAHCGVYGEWHAADAGASFAPINL